MFLHHLKISWRHLIHNKIYSLINLIGLAVGIASVLLIAMYVHKEMTFDGFFSNSERIFRISLHRIYPDKTRDFAPSAITLAPVLKENYPEVEAATRLHRMYFVNEIPIHIKDYTFIEPRFRFADEDFFKVFEHEFIHGDAQSALDGPNKVVLTESTALKYFGRSDVINETIIIANDTSTSLISGVIQDIPINSHIHFDLLGSIQSVPYLVNAIENNRWSNPWVYTYVKLRAGAKPINFEGKFDQMVETYGKAHLTSSLGADYAGSGHRFDYFLQPIEDIHLHSNLDLEVEPTSDITYIYLLSVIALIILIISSINYINLTVARSPMRAKEVGIRKVIGVVRSDIQIQFLTESVLITLLSTLMALAIVYFCLPYFNELLNTSLQLGVLFAPINLVFLFLFILSIGLLSGIYPASIIAAIQPSRILKGTFKSGKRGLRLRNGLTTLQFVISIIMIAGSILVHKQMEYFKNKDLGFELENVMIIRQAQTLGTNYRAFRNEVEALPGVINIGGATTIPGDFHGSNIFKSSQSTASDLRANITTIDDYFFNCMQFQLIEGRSFDPAFNDSLSVIINESAAMALGIDNPIGTQLRAPSQGDDAPFMKIIGIVEDYHFYSLHAEIGPVVIFNGNSQYVPSKIAIRLKAQGFENHISAVKSKWQALTEAEINVSFLDQELAQQYESDQESGWVFDVFTYIAIIMCCTGLFGLTTFIAQQRRKEMSIRKVLGASDMNIMLSFSKEFLLLIGIACLLGMPIAYWIMKEWLANFAYHIEISAGIFLLTVATMIILIMITVSYQSLKLARISPIEALRSE